MKKEEFYIKMRALGVAPIMASEEQIKKGDVSPPPDDRAVFSRQAEADPYGGYYESSKVIKPPYDKGWMYGLIEDSDVGQANVWAAIQNTVGMGFTLNYKGDDSKRIPPKSRAELDKLESFFEEPNPDSDWLELSKDVMYDQEVGGDGFMEVVRHKNEEVALAYHHPGKDLRLVPIDLEQDYHWDEVLIKRNGKYEKQRILMCYRRFAKIMQLPNNKTMLRYYKSWGDPRPMTNTGKRVFDKKNNASELIWCPQKNGPGPYGLPTWIGSSFDIAGRRNAQALNYDLMKSQGIPRMAIVVEGQMSEDTYDEIYSLAMAAQGVESFNKIWIINVEGVSAEIGKKGRASVRFENLSDIQRTDQMYSKYNEDTAERIRCAFRHPPIFVGATGAYSYAVLTASKAAGEEQVFGPKKSAWDKRINRFIRSPRGLGIQDWVYKSKSAEIASTQDIMDAISTLGEAGALTINNAVQLANDALGRTFSKFDKPWANYPISLLKPVLNREDLIGMDDIVAQPAEPALPGQEPQQGGAPQGDVLPPELQEQAPPKKPGKPDLKALPGGLSKRDVRDFKRAIATVQDMIAEVRHMKRG